jgi:hypothetical protein
VFVELLRCHQIYKCSGWSKRTLGLYRLLSYIMASLQQCNTCMCGRKHSVPCFLSQQAYQSQNSLML